MKVRMTRTLFQGSKTLMEGDVIDVGDPEWWESRGFAVRCEPERRYETKPAPERPMLADGEEKPAPASPPVRRSRKRKWTPLGDGE